MRRATKQEAAELRQFLQVWRTPSDVRSYLEAKRSDFGFYSASQGALQPWREAFRATQFAAFVNAEAIRLGEDPPDFYARLRSEEIPVELAEVKGTFDLRNSDWDEHADLANARQRLPVQQYDPTSECLEVAERIGLAVTRKVAKGYPSEFTLAVTANTFWFDDLEETMAQGIARAVLPSVGHFRAIWVLAGSRFFSFLRDAN